MESSSASDVYKRQFDTQRLLRFDLRYFITEGHIDHWLYSTPESRKRIETDFAVAACNPV